MGQCSLILVGYMLKENDFVLNVATINGSGSQSSNSILVKTLFRMGLPVGGKNLFPSNIQGLPTWFTIRVQPEGFTARKALNDIVVAMNPDTLLKDQNSLKAMGAFIYNSDLRVNPELLRDDILQVPVPFKKIIKEVTDSVKLKKLLVNMAYVGVLAELIGLDKVILKSVIDDFFEDKPKVIDINKKAIDAGIAYAQAELKDIKLPIELVTKPTPENKILMDGNTAAALGFLMGGASFMSWYPITPSSSVAESFQKFCDTYRIKNYQKHYSIVQAEDELSAISMVVGAGWAGARAFTCTSGPGLSLMAEAAGLSYFAEIPTVIWDVQRVGPSTGLPTRTSQADLLSAYHLSHGDTKHVVLLPGSINECYEFAQLSLDLAERLQTLVIGLSDLDLGMNLHLSDDFEYPTQNFDRGKVLTAEDLDEFESFARYKDLDGDGITYRTLPGTEHTKAAYFTRGTGHDEKSNYTESPEAYKALMNRLDKKHETAKSLVPKPVLHNDSSSEIGIIAFGSSHEAIKEALNTIDASYLRVRALPLSDDVFEFIQSKNKVFVIEQNRDAQMAGLLKKEFNGTLNLVSICQFDGLPMTADFIIDSIQKLGANNE